MPTAPASAAAETTPHVVLSGVDSLYLGFEGKLRQQQLRRLEEAKAVAARARRTRPDTGEPLDTDPDPIDLGAFSFAVRPYGSQNAPFLLSSPDANVAVNPNGQGPALTVQVASSALWREGPYRMTELLDVALGELVAGREFEDRYVQRIDICADEQGWVPMDADFSNFVGAGRPRMTKYFQGHKADETETDVEDDDLALVNRDSLDREAYYRHFLTGFRVGGRKSTILCRLYDKSEEIKYSRKLWFWDAWREAGGVDGVPVWRLEFQLRREALREMGFSDPGETLDSVMRLWRYCTARDPRRGEGWLRLVTPTNERRTRCPTAPPWRAMADYEVTADGVIEEGRITRARQLAAEKSILVPSIAGYLGTYGVLDNKEALPDVLSAVKADIETYCEKAGESWQAVLERKRQERLSAIAKFDVVTAERRRLKEERELARAVAGNS